MSSTSPKSFSNYIKSYSPKKEHPPSKLKMSPSTMNPTPQSHNHIDVASHSYILVYNFIRENPDWSLDSAYNYCLKYYAEFGVTKEIFSSALNEYIMSKN